MRHKPAMVIAAGVIVVLGGGGGVAASQISGGKAKPVAVVRHAWRPTTPGIAVPPTTAVHAKASAPPSGAAPMSSTAKAPPTSAVTPTTPPPITYTVKAGDTLSGIAAWFKLHGYGALYDANRAVIGNNPNLIFPGQGITIANGVMTMSQG